MTFLNLYGPARSFKYPQPAADILRISCSDILTTAVEPTTTTGRTYSMRAKEMKAVTAALVKTRK